MRRTFTSILALSLSLLPFVARAQSTAALQQGVRVRIVPQRGEEKVGRVVAITSDSIQIASEESPRFVSTFATNDIRRLDRSGGVSAAQGAARGALIGLAAGVLGGIAVGRAFAGNDSMAAALSVMWGGLGGAAAGAFIGAAKGIENWVTLGKPYT